VQSWKPAGDPVGVIQLLHGLATVSPKASAVTSPTRTAGTRWWRTCAW
jgi:alpha-beta hydrolase superfamily lysophospholipase